MRAVRPASLIILAVLAACAPKEETPAVDSLAVARERVDSIRLARVAEAPALRDTAKATLATLLEDPASATWDSVVVIQPPPAADGRLPALVVCGRMGSSPGIGGKAGMSRFVYQGKFTVYVEEAKNREQFAELWARTCGAEGGKEVAGEN